MDDLPTTLAALRPDGDRYRFDTAEPWSQGRTLFGGMAAALAYTAAVRSVLDLPPLRAAQLAFAAPAAGGLTLRPTLLRRGRSAATIAVDTANVAGPVARATFVFASQRESGIAHDRAAAPAVPAPEDCEPFHPATRPLPGHLGRFEFRHAAGSRLFRPDAPAEFTLWLRLREAAGDDPVAALLAIADAPPGAAMVNYTELAPVSTMTWGLDLHRAPDAGDGWFLLRSASEVAADGYSSQAMRIWDRDGRALASARQLVAIFG